MFLLYAFLIAVGGTVPYLHFGDKHKRVPIALFITAFLANLVAVSLIGYVIVPFLYGPFGGPAIVITIFVSGFVNSFIAGVLRKRFTHGAMVYTAFMVVIVLIQLIAGRPIMFRADDYRAMIDTGDDRSWKEDINQGDITPIQVVSKEQVNEANFATAVLELTRVNTEVVGTKTLYYLYSANMPDRVFIATSDISPELPISQPPDLVQIGYLETGEALVQVVTFNNTKLNLRTSTKQQVLTERREQ